MKSAIFRYISVAFLMFVFTVCETLVFSGGTGRYSAAPLILCPSRCICSSGDNITVECSGRNLDFVPDLPAQTSEAYLQDNNINNITCLDFQSTVHLQTLNLSHNAIRSLHNCSFSSLTHLEYLNLAQCQIDVIEMGAFNSLVQLRYLNLSANRIYTIRPSLFQYQSMLKYFDLSSNLLTQIKNSTFIGLSSLQHLSLYNNSLLYNNVSFQPDAFLDLNNLEVLNIQKNQPNDSGVVYPDIALSKLNNLREIYMDGYPASLGPGFLLLAKLEKVVFNQGNSIPGIAYCDLSSGIPDNMFENLSHLRQLTLIMRYCRIQSLSPNVLKPLKNLWSLDLFFNRDMSFVGFENASKFMGGSNLTCLNISAIDQTTTNHFSHVTQYTFQYLKNTKLESLDLLKNGIVSIHGLALTYIPITLKYLSLKNNKLIVWDFFLTLFRFSNLKVLDISDQIRFTQTKNQTYLSRHIETYPSETNLTFNNSHETTNLMSLRKHVTYPFPKSLETVYAYTMKIEYPFYWFTITNNVVLQYLDYSNNFATSWEGPFEGAPSLRYLDLSKNFCTKMNLTFFQNLTSLSTLLLSQNVLGLPLGNDFSGLAFSYLHNMSFLDLSRNNIKTLSEKAFIKNSLLKVLNLSNNFLEYLQPNLENFDALEVLDLSANMLKGLTEKNCNELRQIKIKNPTLKVLLLNNHLVCSCEFIYFLKFLTEEADLFDNVSILECPHNNGTNFTLQDLENYLPILQRNCLAENTFMFVLVSFFLMACVCVVSAVFYYKRWKLIYLYYIGKKHLQIGSTVLTYKPEADVYIIYDDENLALRQFVQNYLRPRLEQGGITSILGEVDFPGGMLYDCIAGAVAGTKKTLVLVSQDAFQGHNNYLDRSLHLAIMHELNTLNHIIVPVLMEDVNIATLPGDIEIYLRNQQHRRLVYDGTDAFWGRLFAALK